MNVSTPGFQRCATENEMIGRTAFLFQSNVYTNNIIAIITWTLTVVVSCIEYL